mgnify:CR=1 FL=1
MCMCSCLFFFQAEDGIRDLVRSRGLGDVYKRQEYQLRKAISEPLSHNLSPEMAPRRKEFLSISTGQYLSLIHI